ncbi:hypothetical protein Gotur_033516 [Gossypium turneri]
MAFPADGLVESFYEPKAYNPDEDSNVFNYPGCPSTYQVRYSCRLHFNKVLDEKY